MTKTHQETFDIVYNGLKAQGFQRSMLGNEDHEAPPCCAYRGDNGRKCAAGILMTDEEYKPEFETVRITSLMGMYPDILNDYPENAVVQLQLIHDTYFDTCDMEKALRRYARKYDLTVPE